MKYQNKRGGRIVLQDIKVRSAQCVYSGCVQLVHSHHFYMKLEKQLLYIKQINVCKMTCFDSLDKLLQVTLTFVEAGPRWMGDRPWCHAGGAPVGEDRQPIPAWPSQSSGQSPGCSGKLITSCITGGLNSCIDKLFSCMQTVYACTLQKKTVFKEKKWYCNVHNIYMHVYSTFC